MIDFDDACLVVEMPDCNCYTQCTLQNRNTGLCQTAWIPSQYAVIGNELLIKDEIGWMVIEVGQTKTTKEIRVEQNLYKKHRKTTDVPKGMFKQQ